jgi:hypothetical protein
MNLCAVRLGGLNGGAQSLPAGTRSGSSSAPTSRSQNTNSFSRPSTVSMTMGAGRTSPNRIALAA